PRGRRIAAQAGGARRHRAQGAQGVSPALLPKPTAPGTGPEDDVQLSLRDHLLELRQRLKWAVIWLGVGFCASYYWSQQIFHFMMRPVLAALPEGEKSRSEEHTSELQSLAYLV